MLYRGETKERTTKLVRKSWTRMCVSATSHVHKDLEGFFPRMPQQSPGLWKTNETEINPESEDAEKTFLESQDLFPIQ